MCPNYTLANTLEIQCLSSQVLHFEKYIIFCTMHENLNSMVFRIFQIFMHLTKNDLFSKVKYLGRQELISECIRGHS